MWMWTVCGQRTTVCGFLLVCNHCNGERKTIDERSMYERLFTSSIKRAGKQKKNYRRNEDGGPRASERRLRSAAPDDIRSGGGVGDAQSAAPAAAQSPSEARLRLPRPLERRADQGCELRRPAACAAAAARILRRRAASTDAVLDPDDPFFGGISQSSAISVSARMGLTQSGATAVGFGVATAALSATTSGVTLSRSGVSTSRALTARPPSKQLPQSYATIFESPRRPPPRHQRRTARTCWP